MKRGDVYNARLNPTEGSEQQGERRPVIIVSRDTSNATSPVVVVVPCTSYHPGRRIYPSELLILAPDGGLDRDSIAQTEQIRAISKTRLGDYRGVLSLEAIEQLNNALLITLDLPGQT